MSSKEKTPKQLPTHREPAPLTIERLVPLFEDMKDFVRATVRGSETMLRGEMQSMIRGAETALREEMQSVHTELNQKIDAVDQKLSHKIDTVEKNLGRKIDAVECAVTEHTKGIKSLETTAQDHEGRITHLESL